MLEDTLMEVEHVSGPLSTSFDRLTAYENDLPPTFADAARPYLTAVRERITRLTAELGLRSRTVSRARSIRALLIAEIVRLEDSTAEKLRGYGAVNPQVARELDPVLHELRELLASLAALAGGSVAGRRTRASEDE